MNNPLNDAKVGASTLAACGYAPVQWKIALGWMRDANMAASGSHGCLLQSRLARSPNITSIGTLKWWKRSSTGPPVDDRVCRPGVDTVQARKARAASCIKLLRGVSFQQCHRFVGPRPGGSVAGRSAGNVPAF